MNGVSGSTPRETNEHGTDSVSMQTIHQYLSSKLNQLADFSGTPDEYDSLVYSVLLCFCETANSTPAAASRQPIPDHHIAELRKKLNLINGNASAPKIQHPPVVKIMKDYIDNHYNQPIKINDLAELTGFSPNYTGKLFRESIGLSVPNYINMLRIKKACELLADTNLKIYQIAYQIGYSESYYFSNLFKKLMKVTPVEYRKDPSKRNLLPFPVTQI